jgi:hypothetical protein
LIGLGGKMKARKKKFLVKIEIPEDVTIAEMKDYIEDALLYWCKSYSSEDPLFDLRSETIKVKSYRE